MAYNPYFPRGVLNTKENCMEGANSKILMNPRVLINIRVNYHILR